MNRLKFLSLILFIVFLLGASNSFAIESCPGSIWGGVWYENPLSSGVEHDLIARGSIEQGIRWTKIGQNYLNTYVVLGYDWDSKGHSWNNQLSPGVGVSLDIYSIKGLGMRTGIQFSNEYSFRSGSPRNADKLVGFVTWYGEWDLKKK